MKNIDFLPVAQLMMFLYVFLSGWALFLGFYDSAMFLLVGLLTEVYWSIKLEDERDSHDNNN